MTGETKRPIEPPGDGIEVEYLYRDGGRGAREPYLVGLEALFRNENSVLAEEDVPLLMSVLCARAAGATEQRGNSELVSLARAMEET